MCHLRKTVLVLVILLVGLTPALAQSGADDRSQIVETVTGFYNWFLEETAYDEATGTMGNPRVDGTYRDSEYLTRDFVRNMDAMIEAADPEMGFMADPFVCAQDVPAYFGVDVVEIEQESATVLLRQYFGFNAHSHNITLMLKPEDGMWKIDAILCMDHITPVGVTRSFYDWYLSLAGGTPEVPGVNPLVEGLYRDYPLLSDTLKDAVDLMGEGGFMADPFLCAQDVPAYVSTKASRISPEAAAVLAEMYFAGSPQPHSVLVELEPVDQQWIISAVNCEVAPEAVAELVYTQYALFTEFSMRYGIQWERLSDWWGFSWDRYVTADLLAHQIELTQRGGLMADPFLCAQDIPVYIEAEAVEMAESSATVHVDGYWATGPGTYQAYPLAVVEIERSENGWKLSDINCSR